MNEILKQLEELQSKRFKEDWKELGRLIIIEELQKQLLWLISFELNTKTNVFINSTKSIEVLPKLS